MNRGEVELLLAYCAAADPRFNTSDEIQASARVAVWLQQLATAEAVWVNGWVARHYSTHHDWPLTIGAVATAWGHEERRRESIARAAGLPEAGELHRPRSDTATEMLALARREASEAAQRGVPERRPAKPLRLAPTAVFEGGHGHE